jgi:flagellar hook-basal body complex protein FliE
MDPISAFRFLASPDTATKGISSMASKIISPAELSELNGTSGSALESFRADRAGAARLTGAVSDTGVGSIGSVGSASGPSPTGSFSDMLGKAVGEVNAKQGAATADVEALLSGKNVSVHQAMISMEEAHLSFQMMVQVRNKLLDSYQELMRMQI